jgi:hypothetical protein
MGKKEDHPYDTPSYSGGSNHVDHSLKPAWANSLPDPISKKKNKTLHRKRASKVSQTMEHLPSKCGDPEFKPQSLQERKGRGQSSGKLYKA